MHARRGHIAAIRRVKNSIFSMPYIHTIDVGRANCGRRGISLAQAGQCPIVATFRRAAPPA
jgi:hypothetical protein